MLRGMKIIAAASFLFTLLAAVLPTEAGEIAGQLESVSSKAKGGDFLGAYEDLKEAELLLWKKMPAMETRTVVLVTEEPPFYGAYVPRPDNRYRSGEPVLIYAEPVGYTISEAEGIYSFKLTADFTLTDSDGQVLGGQRGFGNWEMVSRRPITEFMMYFTYDFSGLPPGEYAVETVVHDDNSDKSLRFTTPIEMVAE